MTNSGLNSVRETQALCPICKSRFPASYIERDDGIYLYRHCPEHGEFAIPVWRNHFDFKCWTENAPPLLIGENPDCPCGCGLCNDHKQSTCCVLLPITTRCNLACSYCFADPISDDGYNGATSANSAADPSFEQVEAWLKDLTVPGQTLVQLSGGEPTLRGDLPKIVAAARSVGCRYTQLNSNGIRLAEDEMLVKSLAEAGLSFVFLQFDGLDDKIYETLRGRSLLKLKQRAIENCARYNIGVALVPTLTPGVNTDQVGDIIRFAAAHSPAVRGVHFQPVSYFGRSPVTPVEAPRYTLDTLLYDIITQSKGLLKEEDFAPSRCDHPLCGLHGDFIVMPGGKLLPLHQRNRRPEPERTGCCCGPKTATKAVIVANMGAAITTDMGVYTVAATAADVGADTVKVTTADIKADTVAVTGTATVTSIAAAKNRDFVGRRWKRPANGGNCCGGTHNENPDLTNMEQFELRAKSHGFTITAMAFQDVATLDIDRLRQCSLHVYDKGKHIPFCSFYM